MAVITRPYSARLRFSRQANERSVQSLSRINPNLVASDANVAMDAINTIRAVGDHVLGGFFTVTEELVEA